MKNVIIFGTGEFGKDAYYFYNIKENINILSFCDNDKNKHNTKIFDINILNPNDIINLFFDEILIASSFDNEIKQQLLDMNICKNKIITLNLNQIKIQLKDGNKLLLAQDIMLDISQNFNTNNIQYHIDHGTLLGIIRDNSLMPWDIDVDFACRSEDKDLVLDNLNIFLSSYTSSYCKINNWKCSIHNCTMTLQEKQSLPMVIKIFNDCDDKTSNSFFVDIELKYEYKENLYWMVGSRKLFVPKNICFPCECIEFKCKKIKVPRNTKIYLESLYGNWNKIVKDWSYDKYTNIQEKI